MVEEKQAQHEPEHRRTFAENQHRNKQCRRIRRRKITQRVVRVQPQQKSSQSRLNQCRGTVPSPPGPS